MICLELRGFNIGFNDVLIGSAVAVLSAYMLILYIGYGRWGSQLSKGSYIRLIKALTIAALFLMVAEFTYSLIVGYRSLYFFLTATMLFIMLTLMARAPIRDYGAGIVLSTSLILSFIEPIMLTYGNRFYPRYPWEKDSIYTTGSLAEYQAHLTTSGLYYLIPVKVINQDVLAHLIEPSEWVRLILLLAIDLALIISLIQVFKKLGYGIASYFVPVFVFWANPGNSFMMGRAATEAYPFLFMYLSVLYALDVEPRRTLVLLTATSLPMVFAHGSPSTIMILLFIPLLILHHFRTRLGLKTTINWGRMKQPLYVLLGVTLIYWGWTSIASIITRLGEKFVTSLAEYFIETGQEASTTTVGWSYTPRYYKPGFEIYGYTWAFPIGVSAALIIVFLARRRLLGSDKGFAESAALSGSSVIAAAYLSYTLSEAGQYWIPVGYFLAMLAVTAVISRTGHHPFRSLFVLGLVLSSVFVYTGLYSPTHAPLEHPDFETVSFIFRYPRYVETSIVGGVIPRYVIAYYDYDLPVRTGIYKGIRDKLAYIMYYGDPWPLYSPPYTLIALRQERLKYAPIKLNSIDVVYTSDYYIIMGLGRVA